jgi:hypothetical protein
MGSQFAGARTNLFIFSSALNEVGFCNISERRVLGRPTPSYQDTAASQRATVSFFRYLIYSYSCSNYEFGASIEMVFI